ncbi:MAG: hypothetical protein M3276_02390 [Actinomycetota bacterium]|nr:hypothetical protein [Actinomycetota bacterium]
MGAAMLSFGIWGFFFAELLPVREGLGWDGSAYGAIAKNFSALVFGNELTSYRIQRVLPSGLVHLGLRVFDPSYSTQSVVEGFRILNIMVLVASAYLWVGIATRLQLGRSARWAGFIGLFVNFANLKFSLYYSTLTDTAAFALSLLMLFFYLGDRPVGLLATAAMGAFVWPTVFYSAIVLFVLPYRPRDPHWQEGSRSRRFATALSCVAAGGAVGWALYAHVVEGKVVSAPATVWEPALPLSVSLMALYIFLAVRPLVWLDMGELRGVRLQRIAFGGTLLIGVKLVQWSLAGPSGESTTARVIDNIVLEPLARPLIFIVAHVMYFGPLVFVTIFLWKRVALHIGEYGVGLRIVMLAFVVLALASESRILVNAWPFFVVFTAKAVDDLNWGTVPVWGLAAMSFAVSRAWLSVNRGSLEGERLAFPAQFYFMNFGPWMSMASYWLQAAVVVCVALVVKFLLLGDWRRDQERAAEGRTTRGRRVGRTPHAGSAPGRRPTPGSRARRG